jgi:hypothetical protein
LISVVLHGGERLEAGDIVMKVAQGNAQAVDVVGMRLMIKEN